MLVDFIHDSFAEGGKKKFPLPFFPHVSPIDFGCCFDVHPCQKCHLDKSLLVQAGIARHWWQKGEIHADQINTDVV